jgi:hypothetical protein
MLILKRRGKCSNGTGSRRSTWHVRRWSSDWSRRLGWSICHVWSRGLDWTVRLRKLIRRVKGRSWNGISRLGSLISWVWGRSPDYDMFLEEVQYPLQFDCSPAVTHLTPGTAVSGSRRYKPIAHHAIYPILTSAKDLRQHILADFGIQGGVEIPPKSFVFIRLVDGKGICKGCLEFPIRLTHRNSRVLSGNRFDFGNHLFQDSWKGLGSNRSNRGGSIKVGCGDRINGS